MTKYKVVCPKCGTVGVLIVTDIYIHNVKAAERQEFECTRCGFKDFGYRITAKAEEI